MAHQESSHSPQEAFSGFRVDVELPGRESHPARILDIGFRTISVALSGHKVTQPIRGAVQVKLQSGYLGAPMEAVARVESLLCDDRDTLLRLEVVDWIGLREQLPPHLRRLLCLRDSSRYAFPADARPAIEFRVSGLSGALPLVDLSITGLSVAIPREWVERLEKGDRVDAQVLLPGTAKSLALVGFVRHVTFEGDLVTCGVLFDANLTSDFLVKQLGLLRFLDGRAATA